MKETLKPWGKEIIIEQNDLYVVKELHMNNGAQCSLQYHNKKTETIYIISGVMCLTINNQEVFLTSGENITISPKQIHRMTAQHSNLVYIECSTNHLNDVVRLEDNYGRS